MQDIVIYGIGGPGREIMRELKEINKLSNEYNILGFIDDNKEVQNKNINGYEVIGDYQFLLDYKKTINVLVCIGEPEIKKMVIERIQKNQNIIFPNFFCRNVMIDEDTTIIGKGNIVFVNTYLDPNIEIGSFNHIDCFATIGHDVKIGSFNGISSYVHISGGATVGNNCFIAACSSLRENISIGDNTTIGMGSMVVKDIEENVIAYGAPCKVIRRRDGEKVFG